MKTGASLYTVVSKLDNCRCYLHYQLPVAIHYSFIQWSSSTIQCSNGNEGAMTIQCQLQFDSVEQ